MVAYSYISDWAMMDVFSVAMFTTLISLNAFDALRADAPPGLLSGFYFLLMAGELSGNSNDSRLFTLRASLDGSGYANA